MATSTFFDRLRAEMRDILGPLVDLPAPTGKDEFAVIRGILPPGTVIPLHSHPDRETMVVIDGEVEGWLGGDWRTYRSAEIIEIRPQARHALRNSGSADVSIVLVTTESHASFFDKVGVPAAEAVESPERLGYFLETAETYGYWIGSPEEQTAIGIVVPPG